MLYKHDAGCIYICIKSIITSKMVAYSSSKFDKELYHPFFSDTQLFISMRLLVLPEISSNEFQTSRCNVYSHVKSLPQESGNAGRKHTKLLPALHSRLFANYSNARCHPLRVRMKLPLLSFAKRKRARNVLSLARARRDERFIFMVIAGAGSRDASRA